MVIYKKSDMGLAEISAAKRTLNARQRQVLILIDGQRTLEHLENYLKTSDVASIAQALESLGYIKRTEDIVLPHAEPIAQILPPEPDIHLDNAQMENIKHIVASSADEHLGIMGRSIKKDILDAANHIEIKACVSQWHMAMRESKSGRLLASELMEHVQTIITESPPRPQA
ncbi:hypothetical protein A7981_05005 [Methylovorus sp. MM2]|nr:hypothetical protein A7981_05005 [Methylovorus sp. MM2]